MSAQKQKPEANYIPPGGYREKLPMIALAAA